MRGSGGRSGYRRSDGVGVHLVEEVVMEAWFLGVDEATFRIVVTVALVLLFLRR